MGDSEGLDVGDVVGGDVTTGGGIGGQIVPMQTAEQVPLAQAAAATTNLRPGGILPDQWHSHPQLLLSLPCYH